ncbi:UNVERIFIED_CONTAM: Beta-glucosidase 10 [Sesamum angustifolium]|uniref:Beta-glucosidase 10 n=1 Tax=Sesamum angustifolium TaxID=2727405 RepID=A0AAW2L7G2_9LAMI
MQSKNSTVNSTQKGNLQDNSGIGRGDFPNGFIFGTGTSAYQVEGAAAKGGRGISVWDDFALRTPNMIADGSNGNVACDMYHKYKEDIKLMKQMGFDSYRFSISWPRVLPVLHRNDKDAVERALDFNARMVSGTYEEQQGLAGSVDWVGLNYYTSDFVAYEKDPPGVGYPADQHCLYSFYDVKGNTIGLPTASSWLWNVPNGLYDHLQYLQNKYKQDMPPLYVTENGVADNNDHALTAKQACVDTTRVQYYQDHLAYLLKAIK